MAPGVPVIAFDGVEKRYGAVVAVSDANFEIADGEFFSLLGPSGCGKTTTLRMIAGFERPSSGGVLLDGSDVSRVPPYKRNVNTVFQHYALFPHLSVFDNVAFGLRSRRVARDEVRARVEEMLAIVRLSNLGGRRPAQLSGGQQQRVALARALVNRPRALLLDEPLGALDLKLREAMQVELKRVQAEVGSTFVYVTHDQVEALTMSDRIAVMHEGRVCQIGTPREVYDEPADAFVASFLGNANLLAARVAASAGRDVTIDVAGAGRFTVPLGGAVSDPAAGGRGAHGWLMVRPERLVLSAGDAPGHDAQLAVTVAETVFCGPAVRCRAHASGGAEFVVDVGPHSPGGTPRPGDVVWLGWAAGDARFVFDPAAVPAPQPTAPAVFNPTAGDLVG